MLSSRDFIEIQVRVDSMSVPSKIGRIPRKIASNFLHSPQVNGNTGFKYILCLP